MSSEQKDEEATSRDVDGVSLDASVVIRYPSGWQLVSIFAGLMISLYLVNLEVTIVSTSLITITDDLRSFDKTSWIVTGFLATYTGFMTTWAKISDMIGRKRTIIASNIIFLVFSLGCGLSQTGNQIVIFRSLQGLGGAGTYSLTILCAFEIAPKPKLPLFGMMVSLSLALASLTGPIIGGALSEHSKWRWVFYINLPLGVPATLLIYIAMDVDYGSIKPRSISHLKPSVSLVQTLDLPGSALTISGTFFLITALNETFVEFSWSSPTAIVLVALSGISWISFFVWEWYISVHPIGFEPIFPKHWFCNRAWMGVLLTTFVSGCPWNVVIVYLAQRLQVLSNLSPLEAGIRIIPYSALATATAIPVDGSFPAFAYAYEAIAGAGVGVTIGILILATPFVVQTKDIGIATGALMQYRFLGGAVGLAIASNILNGRLKSKLVDIISPKDFSRLLSNIEVIKTLPSQAQEEIIRVFGESYKLQYQVTTAGKELAAGFLPMTPAVESATAVSDRLKARWPTHRDKVRQWFDIIRRELGDPAILLENMYNMDETGVLLSVVNSLKVLVNKDDLRKHRETTVKRTLVTAIECISLDGRFPRLVAREGLGPPISRD
ncbi:major facilitator superfamily domain-containing protein [Penicillium malachiteum]|nr:major facilitator superfamily domain-containing protein [Penicillium malachiteum]